MLKSIFNDERALTVRNVFTKDAKRKIAVAFLDGMVKAELINENVIKPLMDYSGEDDEKFLDNLLKNGITAASVKAESDFGKIIEAICEGFAAVFIDNEELVLTVEVKGYKTKSISEPIGESISKGPHEGFTEDIMTNMSMIRRRISSSDLKMETVIIGEKTKTEVCICYIEKVAKAKIVRTIKERLMRIDCDEIIDSNYISEYIRDYPLSPFKTIGSTERPDVVSAKILEGRVAILVNGTPVVLTAPYLFLEHFQSPDDYYINFYYATVGRIIRFLSFFISISLPALYVSYSNYHQEEIPIKLFVAIAASREGVPISNILEVIIMLVGFELLREAGDRIPESFGVSLSVVGSLVIGQIAVTAKLISAPVVFIVAITATTGILVVKLKGAIIYMRMLLLFASTFFGIYGYVMGLSLMVIYLFSLKSCGVEYMAYMEPFDRRKSKDVLVRFPVNTMRMRPDFAQSKIRRGEKNA